MQPSLNNEDPQLLHASMWDAYDRHRRQWLRIAVPALILLIAFNVLRLSIALVEVIVLVGSIMMLTSVVCGALVIRTRRRVSRLAPPDALFTSSAILMPDTVVGDQLPWTDARAGGSPSQLGAEGVLWVDGDGFHWVCAERKSHVQIHLRARDVSAVSIVRLWLRSYGLGIATSEGQRAGFIVPRVNRDAAMDALQAAQFPVPQAASLLRRRDG